MIDLLDPKYITIIDKNNLLFLSTKPLVSSDLSYGFQRQLSKNKPDLYHKTINEISSFINKNVKFPNQILLDGKPHLFRRKKREFKWQLFPAGKFNEDNITFKIPYDGIFVLMNFSMDQGERIYINDTPIEINTSNNVIKLVRKNEVVEINSSLSEDNIVLVWFVVFYELSE